MSKKTICRQCANCSQYRPFSKAKVNHLLHFFLSILTGGLWLLVWIWLGVINILFKPYRCEFCGKGKR